MGSSVAVGGDLAAWAPDRSHLVGSAMSLPQMDRILESSCGLSESRRLQLLSVNPRAVLGCEGLGFPSV
ncbi:MAG: hypothetical protein ACO3N7_10685 [Kiritimatiellia bacterium]